MHECIKRKAVTYGHDTKFIVHMICWHTTTFLGSKPDINYVFGKLYNMLSIFNTIDDRIWKNYKLVI